MEECLEQGCRIADVFINIPAKNICKHYSYAIPPGMVAVPGCRVVVPFAARTAEGVIVTVREGSAEGLKNINTVIGEWFDDKMIQLAQRVADYYLCSISETMKLFIPGGSTVKKSVWKSGEKKEIYLQRSSADTDLAFYRRKPAQLRLIERLVQPERLAVLRTEGYSAQTVRALENDGVIVRELRRVFRDSYNDVGGYNKAVQLNAGQQAAYEAVSKTLAAEKCGKYLLYGVTGSGKTEVYLRLAKQTALSGRQVVVLVPEIALTAQLVERFRAIFGGRVGVAHSRLSAEERLDVFEQARSGAIDVLIGARSAIFAPFRALGLIVIDEEHEASYKQEDRPYYDARTVAQWRAEMCNAALLYGSATPSVESWYAAGNGELAVLELPERATGASLPETVIVDMCAQFEQGNRSMLSQPLQQLLQETLDKGEQAIILLNRRGHSTFVSCRECGHVMMCPACDVSLTFHENSSNLRCHYCGRSKPVPLQCPQCSSPYIRYFGTGTQKVEAELSKLYPNARILRMDQDTVSGKRGHERIINQFRGGGYDFLVGTQMVAKGHDIENVSAVGIISADTALNLPDFRAHERTYALLAQAAGRAGRGSLPGRVVIQSYNSGHYAVSTVPVNDYKTFFRQEIDWRRNLKYPPFCGLIKILIRDKDEKRADSLAAETAAALRKQPVEIIGPAPALVAKLNGEYRRLIMVKAMDAETAGNAVKAVGIVNNRQLDIDVDPVNVL